MEITPASVIISSICGSHNGHFTCTRPLGHDPVKSYDPADGQEFMHVQESRGLPPVFWNIPTRDLPADPVGDAISENHEMGRAIKRAAVRAGLRFNLSETDYWALADEIRKQGFTWNRATS